MICFHFTIFVVLETTRFRFGGFPRLLWFAFILLSLSYWKQQLNNYSRRGMVVICFHFTIFVVLETTYSLYRSRISLLWFAFILLSLSYWKQLNNPKNKALRGCDLLSFYYLCRTGNNCSDVHELANAVVICFHFTIFVVLETTGCHVICYVQALWFAFILLSLSYWKQPKVHAPCLSSVVICFHFTIFVVLETTGLSITPSEMSCDLLSFYYLCRTGNN